MKYVLLTPAVVFGTLVILFVTVSPPVIFALALSGHNWAVAFGSLGLWAVSWGVSAVIIYDERETA